MYKTLKDNEKVLVGAGLVPILYKSNKLLIRDLGIFELVEDKTHIYFKQDGTIKYQFNKKTKELG